MIQIRMLDASKMIVERLPRRLAGNMLRESVPENLDVLLGRKNDVAWRTESDVAKDVHAWQHDDCECDELASA